mmetsp:Transcript_16546/g.29247  ORF Transcript_16546/g.29247 Transcript_16546/m.29247 type:complete len:783 (-) Transcript_16546:148-2496(-)
MQPLPLNSFQKTRQRELDRGISGSLSCYRAAHLSCFFDEGSLPADNNAQQELNHIQEMFCMDLKALSSKYSDAVKEIQAMLKERKIEAQSSEKFEVSGPPSSSFSKISNTLLTILRKPELCRKLLGAQKGKSANEMSLGDAAASNNCDFLKVRLKTNPNILQASDAAAPQSTRELTPLMRAAETNALQAAKLLLDFGANPNTMVKTQDDIPTPRFRRGFGRLQNSLSGSYQSALSIAYASNHCQMMELLMSFGAKSNAVVAGTALGAQCLLQEAWNTGGNMTTRKFRLLIRAIGEPGADNVGSSFIGLQGVSSHLLSSICHTGDIHACKAILSKVPSNHPGIRVCLQHAISKGKYDLTRVLLNSGAIADRSAIITLAVSSGQSEIFSLLLNGEGNSTSADWKVLYGPAIAKGHRDMLTALLKTKHCFPQLLQERAERESGLATSFEGTPLMMAACHGNNDVLQILLRSELYKNKDHVNERAGPVVIPTVYSQYLQHNPSRSWRAGETALFLAAASGNCKPITTLLSAGADPSITNDQGDKPIHRLVRGLAGELASSFSTRAPQKFSVAAGQHFAFGLMALLKHSPDLVDSRDSGGNTPLMLLASTALQAAGMSQRAFLFRDEKFEAHYAAAIVPMMNVLLQNGADLSAAVNDKKGKTIEECISSQRVKRVYLRAVSKFRKENADDNDDNKTKNNGPTRKAPVHNTSKKRKQSSSPPASSMISADGSSKETKKIREEEQEEEDKFCQLKKKLKGRSTVMTQQQQKKKQVTQQEIASLRRSKRR